MATNGTEAHPAGPYKLVTVNTAPDRAKIIVGRICEEIKDQYIIDYVANSTNIEDVKAMVEEHRPDVMFTASMWTAEEAEHIVSIAKSVVPTLKTMSLPKGLQVEGGPDAVVKYAMAHLPGVLAS